MEYLEGLRDLRAGWNRKHQLTDMMTIAVCALIYADDRVKVAVFDQYESRCRRLFRHGLR